MITKTFMITTDKCMMQKIERFLAWLHWNTRWGHSATIAIDCDGDGDNDVTVEIQGGDIADHKSYVDRIPEKKKSVEWITCD